MPLEMVKMVNFFLTLFIYFLQTEITRRQRGRQRERKGSRLPAKQRAQHGARSQDPETTTRAEGRGPKPLSHPGAPNHTLIILNVSRLSTPRVKQKLSDLIKKTYLHAI